MRKQLRSLLSNPKNKHYFIVSDFLAFFTVVSILSIVLETVPSLAQYNVWFAIIEWVSVAIFSIEYVARVYVAKKLPQYIFSFFGIIDLVSILPSLLGLGNFTFLKSARALRIIRLLRMARMSKFAHLKTDEVEKHLNHFTLNLMLLVVVLLTSLLFVGTLVYLAEGDAQAFASIPLGMLWALKVFLIGLPIEYPDSAWGQVVHIIARFVGLTVFGVLVGVVGNIFRQSMFGSSKE